MPIEVWTNRRFGMMKVSDGLTAFLHEGSAYATWDYKAPFFMRSGIRPQISDELAFEILGAVRKPCPYNGHQPIVRVLRKEGYTVIAHTLGDTRMASEHCSVCGLTADYKGNPQFEAAFGSGKVSPSGHPERNYLAGLVSIAEFDTADWDSKNNMLVPCDATLSNFRLIMWLNGWNKSKKVSSLFPGTEVAGTFGSHLILRSP